MTSYGFLTNPMSLKNKSREELEEMFDQFLMKMSDQLEEFAEKAQSAGFDLDYSPASLPRLEAYLTARKVTTEEDDYNDAAAYVGEVVRKNYRGKWRCSLDLENNSLYYGYPVIFGHSKSDVEFSPFHSVRIYLVRPRENHFRRAIDSQINPIPLDLSDLPTEKE